MKKLMIEIYRRQWLLVCLVLAVSLSMLLLACGREVGEDEEEEDDDDDDDGLVVDCATIYEYIYDECEITLADQQQFVAEKRCNDGETMYAESIPECVELTSSCEQLLACLGTL